MAAQRRRRVRPIRKSSAPSRPRKRPRSRKTRIDWRDELIKILIVLVLLVDVVLVFFVIRQCSKPAPEAEEEQQQVLEEPKTLQIEVLNGCGVSGVAAEFTDYLRARGFDVVKTANFEEEFGRPNFNVVQTVVIDRRGNLENGIRVAEALGLGESRVIQGVNEAYLIDATVIIGRDFRQLSSWHTMEH